MRLLLAALSIGALMAADGGPGADCRRMEKLSRRDAARACFTALAASRNALERAEGLWGLGRYEDANIAFRAAVPKESKEVAGRIRWGRLLLERFAGGDAAGLFEEALKLDENNAQAMLGLALAAAEEFDRKAVEFAGKALEKDPKLVEARELLATLWLEEGNIAKAREEGRKAVEASPEALDGMAVLAAADLMEDMPASEWTPRILAVSPRYAPGETRIAHLFVMNRRYREAIDHYRQAIGLDPNYWPAVSQLGVNLMRVGEPAEARILLERAYNAGYRNAATANSLKLLDSYKNFVFTREPAYTLQLHRTEAELLRPYVARETARALAVYEKKYGLKLPGPVSVEMYPDHPDFEVRTMGLPGLGALGVTFGLSVAMDSPSARRPGSFHWAATLWHELSHVYVLAATAHHVPRWFTEGLAVHEETATSPDWGDRVTIDTLAAIKEGKLLPVAQLDRGFIRPEYPNQVVVSYFQAGRICDYIEGRWGWPKILEMIEAYKRPVTTAEVVQRVLGVKPEEFDQQFLAWLKEQHATPLKNFDEWSKLLRSFIDSLRKKDWDAVIATGPRLRDMFPDYLEGANAYEALAEAYLAKGDKAKAMGELARYSEMGGRSPETLKRLSKLQEEAGDTKAAAATLTRLIYIYPVKDADLHRRLGGLRATLGDWPGAADEFRSVLALRPDDVAPAHYDLARALKEQGRANDALDEVLAALEAAPGYRPAQRLLVELNARGTAERKVP
jgi:tetratricopeptide (TPR) repeat protein